MDQNDRARDPHQLCGELIRQFSSQIESYYSGSLSNGFAHPVVLLLGAIKDLVGRDLVNRFMPGSPDVALGAGRLNGPDDELYVCTAAPSDDCLRLLSATDPRAAHAIASCPPGRFPLLVAGNGIYAWCNLPIPQEDLERPRLIEEKVQSLLDRRRAQVEVTDAFMLDDVGRGHPMGAVLIAIVQRSFSLIEGFVDMVRRRNYYCAIPLLRLQIDNMLRLSAFDAVDDIPDLQRALLQDEPFGRRRSRDGKALTDAYLRDGLSDRFPWINRFYEEGCGYVHFSGRHVLAPIRGREWNPGIGPSLAAFQCEIRSPGPFWSDASVLQSVNAFIQATDGLLDLCKDWVLKKGSATASENGTMRPTASH